MAKQYTTNTFSLEDLKRFNKWKSENPDYNFEMKTNLNDDKLLRYTLIIQKK